MTCLLLLFFLLSISTILLFVNGDEVDVGRIVGGHECTTCEKFSYQVSLEVMGETWCGGGIITRFFVVTAAHCVIDSKNEFDNYPIKVIAGVTDLNVKPDPNLIFDVVKISVPKEFDIRKPRLTGERTIGDIAILKLSRPMDINMNSKLSALEPPADRSYAGYNAIITGFGWNMVNVHYDVATDSFKEDGGYSTGKLRFAETKVISNEMCQRSYENSIMPSHICANVIQQNSWQPEGICSGDSGGPLVYGNNTLIGIVSTSPVGCDERSAAAVYTRVSSYLDFIYKATNDLDDVNIRTTNLKI